MNVMLQRILASMGFALLLGLSAIAIVSSVGAQSTLFMFAALIAIAAIVRSNEHSRF